MMKYILSVILFLNITAVFADCGCEGDAYIHISYVERGTGLKKTAFVSGTWWAIHYSATPYGPGYVGNIIHDFSPELKINEMLSQGSRFRVVKASQTAAVMLGRGFREPVTFISFTGEELNYKNVRKITKVHQIKVGCTVLPYRVKAEHYDTISKKAPSRIRKVRRQGVDQVETHYLLDYPYKGGVVTLTVYPKSDGCA